MHFLFIRSLSFKYWENIGKRTFNLLLKFFAPLIGIVLVFHEIHISLLFVLFYIFFVLSKVTKYILLGKLPVTSIHQSFSLSILTTLSVCLE